MRIEKDVLGELEVPKNVYWGINTQRALLNFQISDKKFPESFLNALALIKKACLQANVSMGNIEEEKSNALFQALEEILDKKKHLEQFPIDVFQTGSGTQINMNMNEVLANRANEILGHPMGKKYPVHPNDHVNKGQSSNDVIPTAMHLATIERINSLLIPAVEKLENALEKKIDEFRNVIKIGRTHLQDAVPIPLSMEFEVYRRQVTINKSRLVSACDELCFLPIGGTACGTGINTDEKFGAIVVSKLKEMTGIDFKENPVKAEGIASHNTIVKASGVLRLLALSLIKMANDIRWMGSGPRAGLGELILPANEPGSSIMPGKINPTQSEALIQVCLQVIGNDAVISQGESFGSILDLNVTKPMMIVNLLESIKILSNGIISFITHCLLDLKPNLRQIQSHLDRMLMTVTNLTPIIGYDKAGEIARIAHETGKTIKEVIIEQDLKIEGNLDDLLDPKKMI